MCPHCGNPKCFQDSHHRFWPRKAYVTRLEREFRGMFQVKLWRCQHMQIHRTTPPPPKPHPVVMQTIIAHRKEVNV